MTLKVIIEPPAEEDIEKAYYWIAIESRSRAIRWFRDLVEAIESLKTFPERCPLAPESGAFQVEIHQLLYGKKRGMYRILFTIQDDNVYILHVRHCAQEFLEP